MFSFLSNNKKKKREKAEALRRQAEIIQIVVTDHETEDFDLNRIESEKIMENNSVSRKNSAAKCLAFNDKIEYSQECLNTQVIMQLYSDFVNRSCSSALANQK